MLSIGGWIEWPSSTETFFASPHRNSFTIRKRRRASSLTKRSKWHGDSAARNLRSSSTEYWTASRRNWKVNGNTRSRPHSETEADPGPRLRSVPDFLQIHPLARAGLKRVWREDQRGARTIETES